MDNKTSITITDYYVFQLSHYNYNYNLINCNWLQLQITITTSLVDRICSSPLQRDKRDHSDA